MSRLKDPDLLGSSNDKECLILYVAPVMQCSLRQARWVCTEGADRFWILRHSSSWECNAFHLICLVLSPIEWNQLDVANSKYWNAISCSDALHFAMTRPRDTSAFPTPDHPSL